MFRCKKRKKYNKIYRIIRNEEFIQEQTNSILIERLCEKETLDMKKRIIVLLLCGLFLLLQGCGDKIETKNVTNTVQETMSIAKENAAVEERKESEKETIYPVTVTDQVGRQVTMEKEPQTIVSGYYISTSLLIALGQEEKLVGIENNPEKRPIYQKCAPRIMDLPQVGTVKELDLEQCALLQPDLIILPFKLKDTAESLEQLGMKVLYIKPESQKLLEEATTLLGIVTNSNEQVENLQSMILDKTKEMQDLVGNSERPTVYITGNSNFLTTAGCEMYQHSLIEAAGGENVAKELKDFSWAEISYEQLLAWNPEYIILAADAKFDVETVLTDENLAGCQAVKNGNVYQMPNEIESWDSPIPGSMLGSLWLANVLHPDGYDVSRYESAVEEFYREFYGL